MKRQNERASRVNTDTREQTNVANYHYKLQSDTVRWKPHDQQLAAVKSLATCYKN